MDQQQFGKLAEHIHQYLEQHGHMHALHDLAVAQHDADVFINFVNTHIMPRYKRAYGVALVFGASLLAIHKTQQKRGSIAAWEYNTRMAWHYSHAMHPQQTADHIEAGWWKAVEYIHS